MSTDTTRRIDWRRVRSALYGIVRCVLFLGSIAGLSYLIQKIPYFHQALGQLPYVPALPFLARAAVGLVLVLAATLLFARWDRKSLSYYGLPGGSAAWRRGSQGLAVGALAFLVVMAVIVIGGGYSVDGLGQHGGKAFYYGLIWALVFAMIGANEEILIRGYLLTTLSRSIGFWPAALVTSVLFGLGHAGNPSENWLSELLLVAWAMGFCLIRRWSGSLWFLIGYHAAWDYSESFIFSVPDSGTISIGRLLQARLHGPTLLTGGGVGPEDSVTCVIVTTVVFLAVLAWFRPRPAPPQPL